MLGTAGPAVRIHPGNGGDARVFGKRGALSCHLLSGQESRQTGPGGRCPWRWRTPRRLPAGSLAPQTRAALPPSSPSGTWGAARGARQPLWAPESSPLGAWAPRSAKPDARRGQGIAGKAGDPEAPCQQQSRFPGVTRGQPRRAARGPRPGSRPSSRPSSALIGFAHRTPRCSPHAVCPGLARRHPAADPRATLTPVF